MRSAFLVTTAVALATITAACGGDGKTTIDAPPMTDAPVADAGVLTAPDRTWTWIQMPGTVCGNGSTAGFAINLAADSAKLFYYFEGGGGCYDANTCFTLKIAARIGSADDNVDMSDFNALLPLLQGGPLFDRTNAGNAFANATFVYMPYCTGDLYSGDHDEVYTRNGTPTTVHHQGGHNTKLVLDALHATLPGLTQIWDVGSSAGGYGATFNHHNFAATWPAAHVDLLADCAPFIPVIDNPNANYALWQSHWSMEFPPNCTGCTTSMTSVIDAVIVNNPTSRIGLLAYDQDAVIKGYFGYGNLAPTLTSLISGHYATAHTHAFVLSSNLHPMLGSYDTVTEPGGPTLATWVQQWATGDAGWTTVP